MSLEHKKLKFNWVLVNSLALGTAPFNSEDVLFLKSCKIKSILSLCNEKEFSHSRNFEKEFLLKKFPLPDHKYKKDITIEELENVTILLSNLMKKGPVYVHCFAAIERSPIACMAWLIKNKKMTTENALFYLMEINKGTSPLSRQLEILRKFEKIKLNKI